MMCLDPRSPRLAKMFEKMIADYEELSVLIIQLHSVFIIISPGNLRYIIFSSLSGTRSSETFLKIKVEFCHYLLQKPKHSLYFLHLRCCEGLCDMNLIVWPCQGGGLHTRRHMCERVSVH